MNPLTTDGPAPGDDTEALDAYSRSVADVATRVSPSVVKIEDLHRHLT